jgi:DNA-binding NarL/FixJ family response regulator
MSKEQAMPRSPGVRGPGMRALVVEDDPSWQQILSEILNDCGLVVDLAVSYENALSLIHSAQHRIAVLDLSLGGPDHHNQDGLKVLTAIKRQDPGCASIFLTGFATVELAVNVILEMGAYTCLRKETFKRVEFRKVLTQALAAAAPLQAALSAPGSHPGRFAPVVRGSGSEESLAKPVASGTALVVEDDAGWRGLLSDLLAEAGYQIQQCSSYVEAQGALRSAAYQLAVVDLSLASSLQPEANQDGFRLLVTTQKLNIPTIIVSGYADPGVIERAYAEYQLFACLEKQAFDRRGFLNTVRKARQMQEAGSGLQALTGREREVLALLARGLTNKEIASSLTITANTVKRHLKSLFVKLNVNTRSAASAIATRAGITD